MTPTEIRIALRTTRRRSRRCPTAWVAVAATLGARGRSSAPQAAHILTRPSSTPPLAATGTACRPTASPPTATPSPCCSRPCCLGTQGVHASLVLGPFSCGSFCLNCSQTSHVRHSYRGLEMVGNSS